MVGLKLLERIASMDRKHVVTEVDDIVAQIVTRVVRLADERDTAVARVSVAPEDNDADAHVYVRLKDETVVEVYVRPQGLGRRFLDTEIYNLKSGLYMECHCVGIGGFLSAIDIESERMPIEENGRSPSPV